MDSPAPHTSANAARRQPATRLRTAAEQIADGVGVAILRGEYAPGERIGEQEVADHYGISRGPVREALRALAGRGLVEFVPRRGAFAVDVSLDTIADFFNVRAALMGLAARCFTRAALPAGLPELEERIAALATLAGQPDADAIAFAEASGRAGGALYRHCGNPYLARTLREQVHTSLWGLIWHDRPLDFTTPKRRRGTLRLWQDVARAARAGDDAGAERVTRRILIESRDGALQTLSAQRSARASLDKLIPI